jgi:phospholipase/carboxylesterase
MREEKKDWAGLTSLVVHDLPEGAQPRLAVVLCHGYGASGTDLVGLAQSALLIEPALRSAVAFVFPAARLSLDDCGIPGGRAWWPIDLERLIYRPTPEFVHSFRTECADGLSESRDMLIQLLDEAGRELGVPAERFVLGGFSQGAMLALDVALRLPAVPAAVCVLSGGLTNERQWRKLLSERGPLNVLQSHGRYDTILPLPMAMALRDLLLEAGAEVDFLLFDGDHEIPPAIVRRMAALLKRIVGGA